MSSSPPHGVSITDPYFAHDLNEILQPFKWRWQIPGCGNFVPCKGLLSFDAYMMGSLMMGSLVMGSLVMGSLVMGSLVMDSLVWTIVFLLCYA